MNCDEARELVVRGARWLRGRRARSHVSGCSDCTEWFAAVDEMAALLKSIPSHAPSDELIRRMHLAAHTARPPQAERRKEMKMGRLAFYAAGTTLAIGIAVAILGPHGGSIAAADLRRAFSMVDVVHITGEDQTISNNVTLPLAMHKDKWLRREPFAVYEAVTPADPHSQSKLPGYTFAGSADHTWWYFPSRGNKAVMSKGLGNGFLDELIGFIDPSRSGNAAPSLKVVGHDRIDGRPVLLLRTSDGDIELAVDEATKLTRRLRQFQTGADGKPVELTRLYFAYDQTPPAGVFTWQPPAGANVVDKRRR